MGYTLVYMGFKICFVLPEYNSATPTHFNYAYDLVKEISKNSDIFLIAERGGDCPDFIDRKRFYLQKFRFMPLRVAENLLLFIWLRLRGYRDFYIHYSFLSAFNASIAVKILNGRTFYWNCGLSWLYKRNFLRDFFERIVYKSITFLVTGTENLKKQYSSHYHLALEKIKVMPNLIDCRRFSNAFSARNEMKRRLNISPEFKVILFAHCLSKRKGAHYLPEIAKRLNSIIPNSPFVILIIGDGPERKEIESRIRNYGLWDKARFLGWIPNAEIQEYFGMADIFILPSEEEGFPHVILEAMAAEVPFVAFAVGGVSEISPPHYKYLVSGDSLDDFVNKVKNLILEDDVKIKEIKKMESDWVKQFDLRLAIEKFKRLLNNHINYE